MNNYVIGDQLAEKLASLIGWRFLALEDRVFPDGEIQPRLKGEPIIEKAILIFQKKPKEDINAYLIKYLLTARKLRESAKQIIGIMPYLPYARQDDIFRQGEPLSSLYIAELLEKNLDVFITINMHQHRQKIGDLFDIPAYNLSIFGDLALYFQDFNPEKTVIIGPDEEAEEFVEDFCAVFPGAKIIFNKIRNRRTGKIRFQEKKFDFSGKDIIIIDDIVATADTIVGVAKIAKKLRAKTISFAFVHPVYGDKTIDFLKKIKPRKIVTANTLSNTEYQLDIAGPLARFLKTKIKNLK